MPADYHSSPVQSWYLSAQRDLGHDMMVDVAYVGNRANDLLLFANYNQAAPNNSAGTIPLQARRPIPEFADITYAFNGGKSRYQALQMKYEWRLDQGLTLLSSLTLSEAKDNGAGSLENANGNSPSPQDFYNMDADFGLSGYHQPYNSTTSVVWELPVGRGKRYGSDMSPALDALAGGWQLAGHQHRESGRDGDVRLHSGRGVPRVGHRSGFSRRQQLPAERQRRSVCARGPADDQQLVQQGCGDDSHRPEPAVRQRSEEQRSRPWVLADGSLPPASRCLSADRHGSNSGSRHSIC